MSKSRTSVYLLIAALSLAVAVWQPRDAVVEHAAVAVARMLQVGSLLPGATGLPAGVLARTVLQVAPH